MTTIPTPPADAALAPCPWCGTEPNTSERTLHGGPCWSVYCRSHDCEVAPAADFYETEAAAIAAWNRRPPAPPSEGAALAERLEALAKKATPGPWRFDREDNDDGTITFDISGGEWLIAQAIDDIGPRARRDFEFIVALRNNLPAILAALRQPAGSVVTAAQKREIKFRLAEAEIHVASCPGSIDMQTKAAIAALFKSIRAGLLEEGA